MLKFIAATMLFGTMAMSSAALAQGNGQKQLSWDQLIQACQNPSAFQTQRPPNAIRLTCEDSQIVWESAQQDALEIDNHRSLVASLSSDKFYVVRQESGIPMSSFQTACPRLKEVQVTYTKSFALTCQEIINFRGSMHDFCKARVDSDLKTNAALATRTETGNVYNMCASPELVTGGKAQPGEKQPAAQPPGEKQPSGGPAQGKRR